MAAECPTSRCFFFGKKPNNKATITVNNNSDEPVQVISNGKVVGTIPPNGTKKFPTTIGHTFQLVQGSASQNVKVTKKNEVVNISNRFTNRLYPLAHNRDVSDLKSIDGKTATAITFVNKTMNDVNVDWINYEGKLQRYKTLKSDESYRQETFVTHPWEVVVEGRTTRFLPTTTAEYTAVIGSTDNPTLIRLGMSESANLKSGQNGPATSLNFFNDSTSDATISWIGFQGERKLYKTLKHGEGYHQHTFINHPWEVVAGQDTARYMPINSEADVCIE